jgi:hypothetical protein
LTACADWPASQKLNCGARKIFPRPILDARRQWRGLGD